MADINILDENTINKIAAGEVVERPVNVIKELVENAIDSGADNISIEIKGGGIDYIRITDNGSGIEKENVKKAFLRHATSKIRSIEDLYSIGSLGFRGEALSSIAAVSKTEMFTKTAESITGSRYCINGGREMSFDEAGVPDGTTVIVRDLFYNTPARRKFLKSAMTESGYITSVVERMILSHPFVSFKYVVNGSLKLTSMGTGDPVSSVYSVFGRNIQRSLVEINEAYEDCVISGFVAKPEISRGNRDHEIFFVNGRLIKSNVLSSATESAYKPFLMQHRFPFVLLYLEIPPEKLDVNIHPAKAEIRFMDEMSVRDFTVDAITKGITKKELIVEQQSEADLLQDMPEIPVSVVPEPFEVKKIENVRKELPETKKEVAAEKEPVQETLFKDGLLGEEAKSSYRIIGQLFDTYFLLEYEDKLYITDQHAAHEKVLFERIKKQIESGQVASQQLSPPCIITLSGGQEEIVRENIEAFNRMGFEVEHFGGREYAISAVPVDLFGMNAQDYFLSAVDGLSDIGKISEPSQVYDRIATMACKAAVKGNMKLSFEEARALIDEMMKLENPYNCPHGRPTIVSFSEKDIEKMFKRIV